MDTDHLDVPCGFCVGRGRREIPGGTWIQAPECPDCAGVGHLVTSEEGERLLGFVQRHIGHVLQREITALRAALASTSAEERTRAHASNFAALEAKRTGRIGMHSV